MKITNVRLIQVEGVLEHEGEFWEERLIRPIDIYPEYKNEGPPYFPKLAEGQYRMVSNFVRVETDEGFYGIGGPLPVDQAYIIATQFKPFVMGVDPLANERIWDVLYRQAIHGRKGVTMQALSMLDCALWDLKGRWANAPVYRVLGGPTRTEIPTYASALGLSLEPGLVRQRAREIVEQGFRATKWFFRNGPADGPEGIRKNVELVRTLREAVGEDVDIMLDCWSSWDVPYAIRMAELIEQYRPRWIEEPVLADKIESCAIINRSINIPVATGEHEYTRWGIKLLLDAGACDVLQPDISWAGGITEMVKICAIASAYDIPVIPHGHSVRATVNLIASQPAPLCPLLEYLVKWNVINQFFLKYPLQPVNGVVQIPDQPGLGMDLDEAKIKEQRELTW